MLLGIEVTQSKNGILPEKKYALDITQITQYGSDQKLLPNQGETSPDPEKQD